MSWCLKAQEEVLRSCLNMARHDDVFRLRLFDAGWDWLPVVNSMSI